MGGCSLCLGPLLFYPLLEGIGAQEGGQEETEVPSPHQLVSMEGVVPGLPFLEVMLCFTLSSFEFKDRLRDEVGAQQSLPLDSPGSTPHFWFGCPITQLCGCPGSCPSANRMLLHAQPQECLDSLYIL